MKVLFLGAGASVPGGYPPGARLLDAVEDFFAKEVTDGASREAWGRFTTWRTEAAEKEATRLLLGSTNPEVVISYMDLVEQAAESEYIRLEAALRDGLNTLKRTTDPTAHQTTYEWILEGQEAGYRSPDLGVARKVQRARRDLRLSINAFLEFSHFRDRDRFPSGPEYLAAVMARLTSPSVVITTNYDTLCERTLLAMGLWAPNDGYGFDVPLVGQRVLDGDHGGAILPTPPAALLVPSAIKVLKLHGSYGWISRDPVAGPRVMGENDFRTEPRIHLSGGLLYGLLPHEGPLAVPLYDRREPTGVHPGEPTLTLPTFMKRVAGPELQSIWAQSAKALGEAEAILIVGASLPESDLAVRTLFNPIRLRLAEGKVRVVVQDPSSGAADRWKEVLGNSVEWNPTPVG
ncbi:MAG: hypothetical protein IPP98_07365 [Gemmatimonadetes bacterium]|nr:hypothetical protein [Gemmatimonadota bacterium]MBL0178927.1 hypothetical protein [Gemmatimonadota bacterium]